MLRAALEAIKSKTTEKQTANPALLPVKRNKVGDLSPDDDDAEELMALLDEIDQLNQPATLSIAAPLAPSTASKTLNASALLSSENDESWLGGRGEASVIPHPIIGQSSTNSAINRAAPPPLASTSGDFFQCLPQPFYPDSFSLQNWLDNAQAIHQTFSAYDWTQITLISSVNGMKFGQKCPLMLVMIKSIIANVARNVGVTLLDESGAEMTATIHEAIFTGTNDPKIHTGMSFLLKDVTIFYHDLDDDESDGGERHLVVCPSNILKVFSNVHFI